MQRACFSEPDFVSSICRESFYEFLVEFWDVIIPEKMIPNWHVEYLCNELQIVVERVFNDQPKGYDPVINVPPGTTKGTIASIMFPAWIWAGMPSAGHVCVSHTFNLAMDLSRRCRDLITEGLRNGKRRM